MVVLIIDNYDSFVFNLAQYVGQAGAEPAVYRNDAISIDDIELMAPSHIIISPGPKSPLDAGISNNVIKSFAGKIPILGVCLGHQCIGHVYGGRIERTRPVHGRSSSIYHDNRTIYSGVKNPFETGRYHSLAIRTGTLSDSVVVSATTADGDIMGVRHRRFVVEGVQFHPESVLTPAGYDMIGRFLSIASPVWNETF
jgi:anthranilate synthase/aminodeoxychorismate synthase-like glutamine amidotransferase